MYGGGMVSLIILLLLMFVFAVIATDSFWWGLGITLFICLAMYSMYWAFIFLVLSVASLFLVQGRPE
jgi:hypothetical protein